MAESGGDPAEVVPMFTINQETLAKLVQDNDSSSLEAFGGIQGIMAAVETNPETGIVGDAGDLYRRHQAFGANLNMEIKQSTFPGVAVEEFFGLALQGFKDTIIILLLCCALVSLLIEIKIKGPVEGLIDGAILFLEISFVLYFGLICRFIKSRMRRWRLVSNKKEVAASAKARAACVVRQGKILQISESEVVVGDIVCLQTGNHVPADGLFVEGTSSFKLYDDDGLVPKGRNYHKNPSLFVGVKVKEGNCKMLVLSVGKNTERSQLMRFVTNGQKNEESRLQISVDDISTRLEKIWLSLSLFVLLVQLFRCFLPGSGHSNNNLDRNSVKNTGEDLMNESAKLITRQGLKASRFVRVLSILIFAMRDVVPLGIFVTLCYASLKIKSQMAIVRRLSACATMGLITTICTDGMTNDLVLQRSTMADLWVGFEDVSKELISEEVLGILQDGFCKYYHDSCNGKEDAFCYWAQEVLAIESFNWKHKEAASDNLLIHIWHGEFEENLSKCSRYCEVDGKLKTLDEDKMAQLKREFQSINSSNNSPRQVLCFAFGKVDEESISIGDDDDSIYGDAEKTLDQLGNDLIFLAMVSLKNPYPPEVREAIQQFRASGVSFKLVADMDVTTARIMALHSGILGPEEDNEEAVIEASDFLKKRAEDRLNSIENIHVMASASPSDRLLFVQCLRQKNKVVAVTGSSTRDSPSLKEADVGIFMGTAEDQSKEEADIFVPNKSVVSTIFTIIKLGRCIYNVVKQLMQLQLTLNITAFTLNFIYTISQRELQLYAVQVLWMNLIMDVVGALALAIRIIEPPEEIISSIDDGDLPIITRPMWGCIAIQSLFQITILMILDGKGTKLSLGGDEKVVKSMINGCYVFCQVFSLITAMVLSKKKKKTDSIWELDHRQIIHVCRKCLAVFGVIGIVEVGLSESMAIIAHWGRLNAVRWLLCIGIASLSIPIGFATNWLVAVTTG